MIAHHATTGEQASLIIERIHKTNSVRLNRQNTEKMQNFYDVVLRRFVAVGDALYAMGDGGPELGRPQQLDSMTRVLYRMAQDAGEIASAVWGRRLGVFQNAHEKRLRDVELEQDDADWTAWPSMGVFLCLRSLGHVFPVTDQRHCIVTPTMLMLGQMLAQTPILSRYDLVMGTLCSALMLEYTREANRIVPEAMAFLSGIVRLYANAAKELLGPLPNLTDAANEQFALDLRQQVSKGSFSELADLPSLKLEKAFVESNDMPIALLNMALHLIETSVTRLTGKLSDAEQELLGQVAYSLVVLEPSAKSSPLPRGMALKIASTAAATSQACRHGTARAPLTRRSAGGLQQRAIKSLAPRMEDPERYNFSKDKGKKATQTALDRTRREYKREHKAMARELRMDGAMMEVERRQEERKEQGKRKAQRQRAFAWLEAEQGVMNQQVAQGGGLLSGGGMGAARAKARSGKIGVKKGGKF
jgi:nucleolar protein 14